jgi:hypothetical protein
VKPSEINRPAYHRAAAPPAAPPPGPDPPPDADLVATWEAWAALPMHPLRAYARRMLDVSREGERAGGG